MKKEDIVQNFYSEEDLMIAYNLGYNDALENQERFKRFSNQQNPTEALENAIEEIKNSIQQEKEEEPKHALHTIAGS